MVDTGLSLRRHYGWQIEGLFQDLTVALHCELDTLGYPRAALFGFGTALVAYNTLAVAMYKSRFWLNKPLLMGEAGMTACGSWNGSQAETGASRATKLGAKMAAFFENGSAGYLVWAWEPNNSCNFAFGPGDPLNGVLQRTAATLTP